MGNSILKILSSLIGFLAAFGIDRIIAKWVAYFTIAWEKHATESALKDFNEAIADFKKQSIGAGEKWEDWRKTPTSKNIPKD